MSDTPQSSEARLRDLAKAIDGLERETAPTPPPVKPKKPPRAELGPKTKLTVRILAWGFRAYWVAWSCLALMAGPPRQLEHLLIFPFSAFVCWVIFQFHKAVMVAAIQKISGSKRG